MAQEPTASELANRLGAQLEAANRGDLGAFMSIFADDAVYDASRDGLGVYRGVPAIGGLIGGWWDAFQDFRLTPEELLDLGNGIALPYSATRVVQPAAPASSTRARRTCTYWRRAS